MNESNKIISDKLLDMEKFNPSHREKYERQVQAMVGKKLTRVEKWSHVGGLIMGLFFAIFFGTVAVIAPKELPLWGRFIFAIGAVGGLAMIAVAAGILKKGTINLKKDTMAIAVIPWCVLVIIASVTLVFSGKLPDPIKGIHMLVGILVFLVMAGVFMTQAFVERSEINTREKLLEIEYRLAELAEKIEGKSKE